MTKEFKGSFAYLQSTLEMTSELPDERASCIVAYAGESSAEIFQE
jgi:hypothetical protein